MQTHPPRGLSRRAALQAGAIGLLGLGTNHLSALRALGGTAAIREPKPSEGKAGSGKAPEAKAASVVYIFLSGGLAQQESFDMKPDAPAEFRGEFKPERKQTNSPSTGQYPVCARQEPSP